MMTGGSKSVSYTSAHSYRLLTFPLMNNFKFEVVLPALVVGRLLLAFAPLPDTIHSDHQLSSPLTAYPRCAPAYSIVTSARPDIPTLHSTRGIVFILTGN